MKKKAVAVMMMTAVLLTGCTDVPNLSKINRNIEAEYMAGTLLKYDKNYQYSIDYDRSVLDPTPVPTVTPTPKATEKEDETKSNASTASGSSVVAATEIPSVSLEQLYQMPNIKITSSGYELKESFGSSYAKVSASAGKRLVVVRFTVKNSGNKEKRVNMSKKSFEYLLQINGKTVGSPLLSIMSQDLQFFNQKMASGKSKQAVLLFEVDQSQKIREAELTVSNGNNRSQITLN